MNRTLLLENLPDLLEDLDARLTALEAAEPQAQPVKISYVEHLAAEVTQLRESLYASRLDREALQAEIKRLTDGFYALEAQRNALAAQLDDLRNVNAGLRKDNERQSELIAALRQNSADLVESMKYLLSEAKPNKDNSRLRSALQAVEWIEVQHDEFCAWCNNIKKYGHGDDCQRQVALR